MSPGSEEWYRLLRDQFVDVARRRVPEGEVEDVVQDALRVVHERGPSVPEERRVDGLPPVAWCFQVLRFTISNYYRKQRFRRGSVDPDVDPDARAGEGPVETPLESLESEQALSRIEEALRELSGDDSRCGRYLDRLLDGISPHQLAESEGLEESVLYRRVYRCRQKLRAMLVKRGVRP